MYHAGAASALPPLAALGVLFAGIASIFVVAGVTTQLGLSVLVALTLSGLVMLALPLLVTWRLGLTRGALGLRLPERRPIVLNPAEHSEYDWLSRAAAAARVTSWTNRDAILQLP